MLTMDDLLQELEQEAVATRRVLERVPDDRLDWRPHERSLSLGQLAMHVATLPAAIVDVAMRPTFDAGAPIPRPGATSAAALVATLDGSVAEAGQRLRAMGDEGLAEPWRMVSGGREVLTLPRGALLRTVMLNHWYHHRGQLTVYLRLAGAPVPAIYGDSADEKPFPG